MVNPKAKIILKDGREMNFELCLDVAPITVKNFVKLAKEGFYNNLIFHRVIEGFMIQGGGFDKDMKERKCLSTIKGEFRSNGVTNNLKHTTGVISMARTMIKDSAGSQFFICVDNAQHLDGEYAAFGKALDEETKKIAVDISKVETEPHFPHEDVPVEPVIIDRIDII